eukprot:2256998-Prymnesium_polylepis.1
MACIGESGLAWSNPYAAVRADGFIVMANHTRSKTTKCTSRSMSASVTFSILGRIHGVSCK